MTTRSWVSAAELPDQEDDGCDEWLSLFANRDEVAVVYAQLIADHGPAWRYWSEINRAILRRWSPYALRYIKTQAWRYLREQAQK